VQTGRQERKPPPDNGQSLTLREREMLALFRVMTDSDRRLLLSTAERLLLSQAASGSRTPD
jgi:hypothetical protein